MTWTAPLTAVSGTALTAAQFNTHVRDNLNETEVAKLTDLGNFVGNVGANSVTMRRQSMRSVNTPDDVVATSYADSDVLGPAVSIETGTTALCIFGAEMYNSGASNFSVASVGVSGATTVAVSDSWCIAAEGYTAANPIRYVTCHRFTGLTAGTNVFTMQYKVAAGTGTFANRALYVIAL
jgi:hypothetical protein